MATHGTRAPIRIALAVVLGFALARNTGVAAAVTIGPVPLDDAIDRLARTPVVDAGNLRGQGALAIRQGNALYIADGDAGSSVRVQRIERGRPVRAMSWSHSGRWLAYATDGALWIVARHAAAAQRVPFAVAPGDAFAWSPAADVLCVNHQTRLSSYPQTSAVRIVTAGVTALVIPPVNVAHVAVIAFAQELHWARGGRSLALYAFDALLPYARWTLARDAIFTAAIGRDVDDGSVLRAQSNPGGQLALAALTPAADGILYWSGTMRSGSLAADGQTLMLRTFGAPPTALGEMLEHRSWLTFADDASRFAFVAGPFREAWRHKSLRVCTIRPARCRPLAQPPATVAVDPHWQPGGSTIALVRAPDLGSNGGYGPGFKDRWLAHRTLWLQDSRTGLARPLTHLGSGIFWPRWSADGKWLLCFRDGELWLSAANGGAPRRIVRGLARPAEFAASFIGDHGELEDDDAPFAWTDH